VITIPAAFRKKHYLGVLVSRRENTSADNSFMGTMYCRRDPRNCEPSCPSAGGEGKKGSVPLFGWTHGDRIAMFCGQRSGQGQTEHWTQSVANGNVHVTLVLQRVTIVPLLKRF